MCNKRLRKGKATLYDPDNLGPQWLRSRPPRETPPGEIFEVECLVASRCRDGYVEYLVRWLGYGEEDNTWEQAANIFDHALIRKFERQRPRAAGRRASRWPPSGATRQKRPAESHCESDFWPEATSAVSHAAAVEAARERARWAAEAPAAATAVAQRDGADDDEATERCCISGCRTKLLRCFGAPLKKWKMRALRRCSGCRQCPQARPQCQRPLGIRLRCHPRRTSVGPLAKTSCNFTRKGWPKNSVPSALRVQRPVDRVQ